MISLEDILNIDHCEIQEYNSYIHGDYMQPDISPSRDIIYPEFKNIHYRDLSVGITKPETIKELLETRDLFLIPDYLQFGDYDNSCMVERSNQKIFLEEYQNESGVFTITGGYGSSGIAISLKWLMDPENEEKAQSIIDCLNGLNDYPCLDDEDMSNMEYDSFLENLEDYGIRDFIGSAGEKFNLDISDYDQDKTRGLILEIDRNLNYPSYMIESGGICYIDMERLIEPLTLEQLKPVLTGYEVL